MRLRDIGEVEFLRGIRDRFGRRIGRLLVGIGDDGAVLSLPDGRLLVLSCDSIVEGRHFQREWLSPSEIGQRAVRSALSDLAAMGAEPIASLLTLIVSPDEDAETIRQVVGGAAAAGAELGAPLAGGETVGYVGPLILDVLVAGSVLPGRVCRRSGARPGDLLYVSGPLGGSAAGLEALKAKLRGPHIETAITQFRRPEPRLRLGLLLGKLRGVHAVIDISDGLMRDAGHIAEASGVGIRLFSDKVPLFAAAQPVFDELGLDARAMALGGGEEFELLVAVDRSRAANVVRRVQRECGLQLFEVGDVVQGTGVTLLGPNGTPMDTSSWGWDQFRST